MDPQTSLTRALLLLLFLHLLPPAGRSHPLGGTGPAMELPRIQELLDRLQDKVSELQAEQVAVKPHQQDRSPAEAWEAWGAAPATALPPRDATFQALRGLRSTKTMRDSGCFGRRLDRIGFFSNLGCNVLRKY